MQLINIGDTVRVFSAFEYYKFKSSYQWRYVALIKMVFFMMCGFPFDKTINVGGVHFSLLCLHGKIDLSGWFISEEILELVEVAG